MDENIENSINLDVKVSCVNYKQMINSMKNYDNSSKFANENMVFGLKIMDYSIPCKDNNEKSYDDINVKASIYIVKPGMDFPKNPRITMEYNGTEYSPLEKIIKEKIFGHVKKTEEKMQIIT